MKKKKKKSSGPRVHSAGKGDSPRPVDKKTWDQNYTRIFKKNKGRGKGR